MKIYISILVLFMTGCTNLSRQNHLTIDHESAQIEDSFCGYASAEWVLFGTGNQASVTDRDVSIEFCSISYFSKIVAAGFIVPVVPIDGRVTVGPRWIRIKNNSASVVSIQGDFLPSNVVQSEVHFCHKKYPDSRCPTLEELAGKGMTLKNSESVWVSMPEASIVEIILHNKGYGHKFKLIEAKAYSWWMLTV